MFAKLGAFALCLSFVSALHINVPVSSVKAGDSFEIELVSASGDPTEVGLMLIQEDWNTIDNLASSVTVAPRVKVEITSNIGSGVYFIVANHVDDESWQLDHSESNHFTVVGN